MSFDNSKLWNNPSVVRLASAMILFVKVVWVVEVVKNASTFVAIDERVQLPKIMLAVADPVKDFGMVLFPRMSGKVELICPVGVADLRGVAQVRFKEVPEGLGMALTELEAFPKRLIVLLKQGLLVDNWVKFL